MRIQSQQFNIERTSDISQLSLMSSGGGAGGLALDEFAHHTYEKGSGQALVKSGIKKHF